MSQVFKVFVMLFAVLAFISCDKDDDGGSGSSYTLNIGGDKVKLYLDEAVFTGNYLMFGLYDNKNNYDANISIIGNSNFKTTSKAGDSLGGFMVYIGDKLYSESGNSVKIKEHNPEEQVVVIEFVGTFFNTNKNSDIVKITGDVKLKYNKE